MKNEDVKCKLCGKNMLPDFEARGFWIYRCPFCSFEQVLINTTKEGIEYEAAYFDNNKYRDTAALNLEHKRRISILREISTKEDKVVDYGCATGEFVYYAHNDFDIVGCDVSSDAICIAKKRYPDLSDCFMGSDEFLDNSEKYDIIALWDVIEHIDFPIELIERLKEKLNTDGYLVMSTPNIGALFARQTKSLWPFMTPPEHLVFFSKKSMQYLAKKMGFVICKWQSKGKWANVGFILYKFNRVSKIKIPQNVVDFFKRGKLSKLHIYVPTQDIQYVVMRKTVEGNRVWKK